MKFLETLNFINNNNKNWREVLSNPPYSLIIKDKGNLTMLHYNQLDSDMNEVICRECRSIIIRKTGEYYIPVCVPFFKFANYGEDIADELDWNNGVQVEEKVDGSMIMIWWNNEDHCWIISTSGNISAYDSPIADGHSPFKNYGELVEACFDKNLYSIMDKDITYIFEVVSPWTRIVVPYDHADLYEIGERNIKTLEERNPSLPMKHPKHYPLNSLEDCIKNASKMSYDEEGYVVVDSHWKRNKVKSPAWFQAHKLWGNGSITVKRVLELMDTDIIDDFVSFFPDYKEYVENIKKHISDILEESENHYNKYKAIEDQKEFALNVKNDKYSTYMFARKRGKFNSSIEWWNSLTMNAKERFLENR